RIVRDALTETWNGADPNPEEGQAASGDGPQSTDAGVAGASATGATIAAGAPYLDSSQVASRGAQSAAGEPRDRLVTPRYDLVHDPALPVPYDTEAT
ncbi:MAG: hypothetical protein Q4P32_12630, partial [Micrococcales bacterium]|nr:hypothetical protein [Micrococcales bacterium]